MFSVVGQNISSFFSSILKKKIQNEIHNSILVLSEMIMFQINDCKIIISILTPKLTPVTHEF